MHMWLQIPSKELPHGLSVWDLCFASCFPCPSQFQWFSLVGCEKGITCSALGSWLSTALGLTSTTRK